MSQLCDTVLLVAVFVELFLNIHPQLNVYSLLFIVVAISHTLSAIYLNSNECSGGTSVCNGRILLKIHNFPWIYTSTKMQIWL